MMQWSKQPHVHTQRQIHSSLCSLFIIMLTRRVSLGRRHRGSLLFHKGRPISAKSVCASLLIPHHSCIVWLQAILKSLICGIYWKCGNSASEALLPGGFFPWTTRKSLKGKLSKDGESETERGRAALSCSRLQSSSNIERKMPGTKNWCRLYFIFVVTKRSMLLSLKQVHASPWTTGAHQ